MNPSRISRVQTSDAISKTVELEDIILEERKINDELECFRFRKHGQTKELMDSNSKTNGSGHDKAYDLAVPPGFVSHKSFFLKRVVENKEINSGKTNSFATEQVGTQMDYNSEPTESDSGITKGYGRHRPWILFNHDCGESDREELCMNLQDQSPSSCLQKMVTPGCTENTDYLKVTARGCSRDARTEVFENVPIFYPTEKEFEDTLDYIVKISPSAESHGICRIVPPSSWKLNCHFMENKFWESSTFTTHIQQISGIKKQSASSNHIKDRKRKQKSSPEFQFKSNRGCKTTDGRCDIEDKDIKSKLGPEFTLESFKKYADDFKSQYLSERDKLKQTSSLENRDQTAISIEDEYAQFVENPTKELQVFSGCNLDSRVFGSGFPIVSRSVDGTTSNDHMNSGWNLNNLSRLPASLLSFESDDTCSILLPRLHVGMCFSSHDWQVEEHHLPMLSYMHLGDPKIWYCVPESFRVQFEEVVKDRLAFLFAEQNEKHDAPMNPLSAYALKSEGIPVYRCTQFPGEFVLIFPGACSSILNCGFNCAEEAYFAPLCWLPCGQQVVELYSVKQRKTSLSHDKLLLGAAMEAVEAQWLLTLCRKNSIESARWKDSCGKDGVLAQALKLRVNMEGRRRKYLCASMKKQILDEKFDDKRKRECFICFLDLHLSAVCCPCSVDRYSCLVHAKQLCSCLWFEKTLLVRHEMTDLYLLVEAVEGKLSAVYKWATENLGLALHSQPSKSLQPHSTHSSKSSVATIKAELNARLVKSKVLNDSNAKEKDSVYESKRSSNVDVEKDENMHQSMSLNGPNGMEDAAKENTKSSADTISLLQRDSRNKLSNESGNSSGTSDSVEEMKDFGLGKDIEFTMLLKGSPTRNDGTNQIAEIPSSGDVIVLSDDDG